VLPEGDARQLGRAEERLITLISDASQSHSLRASTTLGSWRVRPLFLARYSLEDPGPRRKGDPPRPTLSPGQHGELVYDA